MHAVGNGAVVVQRREHVLHRFQHVVDADHVQERLLLARERRVRQVFRRGGRTDGERHFRVRIGHEAVVEGFDFRLQARLERRVDDPLTDLGAAGGQGADVVHVQAFQALGDALAEGGAAVDGMVQEVAEGLRRSGEAARHAHAGLGQLADHLAERRVLAADRLDVGHAQGFERGDVDGFARAGRRGIGRLQYCIRQVSHGKTPF